MHKIDQLLRDDELRQHWVRAGDPRDANDLADVLDTDDLACDWRRELDTERR